MTIVANEKGHQSNSGGLVPEYLSSIRENLFKKSIVRQLGVIPTNLTINIASKE